MKIFISSTFRDFKEERETIIRSLTKAGFLTHGMEFFVSEPNNSKEVCLKELGESDLVILISGSRYGSPDPETKLSYTHLEFDEAVKLRRPILAFLIDEAKLNHDSDDYPKIVSFRDSILKQDIIVNFFANQNELLGAIWPALLNHLQKKGLAFRSGNVFQDFTEFYSFFTKPGHIFNYTHKLIGREDKIIDLCNFLNDDKAVIEIISGVGGVGKSKLVCDFSSRYMSQNNDYEFRYLSSQIEFKVDSLRELPAKNLCVVVEDAHRRSDLDAILYSLITSGFNHNFKTKLIVTTRPSGLDFLRSCLVNYPPEIESHINLDFLSKEEATNLANSILNDDKDTAKQIVAIASRNTLIIVFASQLIRDNKLSTSLINDSDFVNRVLEKLLDEIKQVGDVDGIKLRSLITVMAGISPFMPDSQETQKALTSLTENSEWYKMSKAIDKLKKLGFLLQRGNTLRVVPDVLADYLLFKESFSADKKPTGFVDTLFENFQNEYYANILQNVVEIEYSTTQKDDSQKLLENIWSEIFEEIKAANENELVYKLDIFKKVAFYSSTKVFELVKWIINSSPLLNKAPTKLRGIETPTWIIEHISPVLKNIAYNPEHTKDVCKILWNLANNKFQNIRTNSHPQHPLRVLSEMSSFDNRNYFSIVHKTLDAIKEIIESKDHLNCFYNIQEVIESALKVEIENHTSNLRQMSISWQCVFDVSPEDKKRIIEVRKKALNALELLTNDNDPKSLRNTAETLLQKLHNPYVRGKISDEMQRVFLREGEVAFELLIKVVTDNKYETVTNFIYTKFRSDEGYFLNELKPSVREFTASLKPSFKSEAMYCISHDWAEFNLDDEHDESEKKFIKRQEDCAKQLWSTCNNDPKIIIAYISNIVAELTESGVSCLGGAFQQRCASMHPELIQPAIDAILLDTNKDFEISVAYWLDYCPEEEKYDVAMIILKNGGITHRRGLACSIAIYHEMAKDSLLDIVKKLIGDSSPEVRFTTISNLGRLYHKSGEPEEIIDILSNFDTEGNANLLERLLGNFDKTYGISFEKLTEKNVSKLLKQVEQVEKLTDRYHIGKFLSHFACEQPLIITELMLKRVAKAIIMSDTKEISDFQVFPYLEFHSKPKDIIEHKEYRNCVLMVIEFMVTNQKSYETNFWCPKIIKWFDGVFSETTKYIFEQELTNCDNVHIENITDIFKEYERRVFFANTCFINKLLLKASEFGGDSYKKIASKLSFMPFSGTRFIPGPGKDDDLCMKVIETCDVILADTSLEEVIRQFFSNLRKYADCENKRKLERDRIEMEEWEDE